MEGREEDRILPRLVRVVHADELLQAHDQRAAVAIRFQGLRRGQAQRDIGQRSAGLVLGLEHVDQVDQLARFAEAGEEVLLFELLVVVLDKGPNDARGVGNGLGRQVLFSLQAADASP